MTRNPKQNYTVASIDSTGEQKTILSRFLDTNGDGTGTKNAIGDYATTPTEFYIQPPTGQVYRIARIIPHIVDGSNFSAAIYGGGSALTNGFNIVIEVDGEDVVNLTDGIPIKTNSDWARNCYDVTYSSFGVGNNYLHARWTFSKSGQYIRLNGDTNDKLKIPFSDSLAFLVEHYFMIQGYIENA